MKTITHFKPLTAALILCAAISCIKSSSPALGLGDPVPAFSVTSLEGKIYTARDLAGKTSVITFFNTWCPDCTEELPETEKLHERYPDVLFLCICRGEDAETVRSFWKKCAFRMPCATDPVRDVYHSFAGKPGVGVPLTCVIGKDGMIKALLTGSGHDLTAYLN